MPSPHLPSPRGPISHDVIKALSGGPGPFEFPSVRTDRAVPMKTCSWRSTVATSCIIRDSLRSVMTGRWDPSLLRVRSELEEAFEGSLRARINR